MTTGYRTISPFPKVIAVALKKPNTERCWPMHALLFEPLSFF